MKKTEFEIRHEQIFARVGRAFSILYLSDLHFTGHSLPVAEWMIEKINELAPDIILLGGDYVDTQKGLKNLTFLLKGISTRENVFAIAGNHDYFFGVEKIKKLLVTMGVNWIEKIVVNVQLSDFNVEIAGNLREKATDFSNFTILCVHNPNLLNGDLSSYDVAFAGHLHGSQFVFWQTEKGLYPGRFFYKWNLLKRKINDCTCLISKGLGDTLPFRFNCKKDMIFVRINPI